MSGASGAAKRTTPAVTVLFSTYNGGGTLPRMLEALCRQTMPVDAWKIVAVDNNSRDDTRSILDAYADRLPLEVYFEPLQGKEHALAEGFRHLEGELVILTDDDVIPDPDWIERLVEVSREQPDFDIFSGLIVPEWERAPEAWLADSAHKGVLYAANDDLQEGPIPALRVNGPNSAFRRGVIGSAYVVHENLGPNASVVQYPMGQDTAFALRLERGGARAFHCPAARVRHIIKKRYVEPQWMLGRAERYGMGLVVVRPELFRHKPKLAGVPVGALLMWLAMKPVERALVSLPLDTGRFRLLWQQRVRQGILRQFNANRAAQRRPRLAAPARAGE